MAKPRHKYEYKVNSHTAAAKIVRMVGVGKRVLELGSGPGAITRLLKANDCQVTALEIDPQAIEIVTPYCERVYSCDLNDAGWPNTLSAAGKFDMIVAGDVLEHLYDPWSTLRALPQMLSDDGYVVISLPHIGHNAIVSCLLNGNFEYQPWGLLDKTHIRFFCIKNIQRMFNDAGFKIIEADFVFRNPNQTEFAKIWRRLPQSTRDLLEQNRFGNIYQVVVKAVPKSARGKAIDLTTIPLPPPAAEAFSAGAKAGRFLAFFISSLSLRTRKAIGSFLWKCGLRF